LNVFWLMCIKKAGNIARFFIHTKLNNKTVAKGDCLFKLKAREKFNSAVT